MAQDVTDEVSPPGPSAAQVAKTLGKLAGFEAEMLWDGAELSGAPCRCQIEPPLRDWTADEKPLE